MFVALLLLSCMLFNYFRFSEKIELFIAKEKALAQTEKAQAKTEEVKTLLKKLEVQTEQLKTILNELDNGILIALKLTDSKIQSKYHNTKIS